ncbi:MAG TPA: hypothetical protein VIM12_08240 [Noviherbaspirillum sp.]|jgi:hypothetical protein|uniref:hypothetical protein n=1 Tax=Noviherbaspirillum sp. TaxID=1926288 RepID=UPI002F92A8BC
MANKALAKRQKMTLRAEPSRKATKGHRQDPPARQDKSSGGTNKPAVPGLPARLLKKLSAGGH